MKFYYSSREQDNVANGVYSFLDKANLYTKIVIFFLVSSHLVLTPFLM